MLAYDLFSSPVPTVRFASTAERDAIAYQATSKVQTFAKEIHSPQGIKPVLRIDEREANALLQSNQPLQAQMRAKGVTEPKISFAQDQVNVSAEVEVGGAKLPITVTGQLSASGGASPEFKVSSVKVGKFGAPQRVSDKVASKIERLVRSGAVHLPPGVKNIRVEEGRLLVEGR
jgi:hypothetical protein